MWLFLSLFCSSQLYAASPSFEIYFNDSGVGDVGFYVQFSQISDTCENDGFRISPLVPMNSIGVNQLVDDPVRPGVIGGQVSPYSPYSDCSPLHNELINNNLNNSRQ